MLNEFLSNDQNATAAGKRMSKLLNCGLPCQTHKGLARAIAKILDGVNVKFNQDDPACHEAGNNIITILQLKVKPDNGRVDTSIGDKTPIGLARTVHRFLTEELGE